MSDEPTCPLWMMTFGDCMSLLVTFFVMLIAFTNIEKDKLLEIMGAMKGALGVLENPMSQHRELEQASVTRMGGLVETPKMLSVKDLSAIIPDAMMATKRFGKPKVGDVERHVLVQMIEEGMAFVISAKFLFEDGSATLLSENEELLLQIGNFAFGFDNEIRITGILPEGTPVVMEKVLTAEGLGIARAFKIKRELERLCEYDNSRFGVGSRVVKRQGQGVGDAVVGSDGMPVDRIEIVIVGYRDLKDISPEEIVIKDKWR